MQIVYKQAAKNLFVCGKEILIEKYLKRSILGDKSSVKNRDTDILRI